MQAIATQLVRSDDQIVGQQEARHRRACLTQVRPPLEQIELKLATWLVRQVTQVDIVPSESFCKKVIVSRFQKYEETRLRSLRLSQKCILNLGFQALWQS